MPGWKEAQELVSGLLQALHAATGRPMAVLGFSQSGSLALAAALEHPERRAPVLGAVLCSSYMVQHRVSLRALRSARVVFLHAPRDPVVPFEWARQSVQALREAGAGDNVRLVPLASTAGHVPASFELVTELEALLA